MGNMKTKYNNFMEKDYEILKMIHKNNSLSEMLKYCIDDIESYYDEYNMVDEDSYNMEFVKLSKYHLNDIFNNCIYKTIMNKNPGLKEDFIRYRDLNYNIIPTIIYIHGYESTRYILGEIYSKTNKLESLDYCTNFKIKYNSNNYKNKKLDYFDKLRYLYKYCSPDYNQIFKEHYEDIPININLNYMNSTNTIRYFFFAVINEFSDEIDESTKQRFYNELWKLHDKIYYMAVEDALLYFIFDKKMNPKYLYNKRSKLSLFIEKVLKKYGFRSRKKLRLSD